MCLESLYGCEFSRNQLDPHVDTPQVYMYLLYYWSSEQVYKCDYRSDDQVMPSGSVESA